MFASRLITRILRGQVVPKSISRPCSGHPGADLVVVEKREKITLIGINRPEKRNCVNTATADQLLNAFKRFEEDDEAYVAILHGFGGNFCAGFDLEELSKFTNDQAIDQESSITKGPMGPSQMLTKKPIIGAINGYAVAGGLELALLCDLRVAEENAVLGVFCRRFGVPLIDGGTVRLPKLIGLSRAMDLILTGRPIKGEEAFEIGLVNRITQVGAVLGTAYNLATSLIKFPQECLRADRMSAYHSVFDSHSMEDALRYEYENGLPIIEKEAIEGAKLFVEDGLGKHGKFKFNAEQQIARNNNS